MSTPALDFRVIREQQLASIRLLISRNKKFPKGFDDSLVRNKPPHVFRGWLLPTLLEIDDHLWGRWDYWARTTKLGRMLDEPIPQIAFERGDPARRMLERSLDSITQYGSWRGWDASRYMDYFLDWILFGFGANEVLPEEPCPGACSRLYQAFSLEALLAWPYDYLGDIMAETAFGRSAGFFPTPLEICQLMVRLQMSDESGDNRDKATLDPCVGTGRMLLVASNFTHRLFGQDILLHNCKATLVNLYLYAPWGAKPFSFHEKKAPIQDGSRSKLSEPAAI